MLDLGCECQMSDTVTVEFCLHHEGLTEYLYTCRDDATGGVVGFENRSVF